MYYFDHTFSDYPTNLAFEESFLISCQNQPERELVRLWHPDSYAVVVGSGSKVNDEVQVEACKQQRIGIFRRNSGGTAVVSGPGCLMYAVVLSLEKRPNLREIHQAHQLVMGKIRQAASFFCPNIEINGICDLSLDGRKFSGNALKIGRTHILYHGTILFDFDLEIVASTMGVPPREPEYRAGRSHRQFVGNLPIVDKGAFPEAFAQRLWEVWEATQRLQDWDQQQVDKLAESKYGLQSWTFRR